MCAEAWQLSLAKQATWHESGGNMAGAYCGGAPRSPLQKAAARRPWRRTQEALPAGHLCWRAGRTELRERLEDLLPASEVCCAGLVYCVTLATFGTPDDADLLAAYTSIATSVVPTSPTTSLWHWVRCCTST
ncbi:DUF6000 family protein [Streptomyces sp. NPDC085866]|uniref:DUF6000 family protein n=1 Tax=Streptomyces sp. NPDC085866 TaxID=3365736 RepID=UPI0037D4E480